MRRERVILLVEDNPNDEALTIRALRKNHVQNQIVVAHDGAEALDYLFGTGDYADRDVFDLPEVVLLDVNLPKMDGLEVLRLIRQATLTALLPVVVLTSSTAESDLITSYAQGANSYVRKPVDFVRFQESVRQVGLYWLIVNEPPPRTGERKRL